MFTHQRPAMPSRYSRPSASTTVESFAEAMTSWRSSSCLWGTMGWITLSRSRRTRSARLPGLVVIPGSSFWVLSRPSYRRPARELLRADPETGDHLLHGVVLGFEELGRGGRVAVVDHHAGLVDRRRHGRILHRLLERPGQALDDLARRFGRDEERHPD